MERFGTFAEMFFLNRYACVCESLREYEHWWKISKNLGYL